MTRILILLAALGTLTSCAGYQEPEVNCFAIRASVGPAGDDCIFTPLGDPEGDIAV